MTMWKITRLYLKNFAHIYSGLDKTEVELNFSDNQNIINVFIGKMGSGKSAILGHLQPFATYGTLDIRNQNAQILPEMDGIKEITYQHDGMHYEITHKYIWNKHSESHNTKSYIKLNGVELNPNGNSNSFKEIIKNEFGVEQNFLRLLRLGPNVTNLIDMKSTDRKNFIASLLPEAEVYTMLYKKLSEEMRNMNSKLSVLSNKLLSLSSDNLDDMELELEQNLEKLSRLDNEINSYNSEIHSLSGKIDLLLNGNTVDEYKDSIKKLSKEQSKIEEEIEDLTTSITNGTSTPIEKISASMLYIDRTKKEVDEKILSLESSIEELNQEYAKLKDTRAISNSKEHIEELKSIRDELTEKVEYYETKLSGFECRLSYANLAIFIDNLNILNDQIQELSEYRPEAIHYVINHPENLSTFASKKIDILTGRKINLQKTLNNLSYSADYTPVMNMYRPPFCPTETCPYFQTHPERLKKSNFGNSKIEEIMQSIKAIDVEIARYTDLPIIQRKYKALEVSWKSTAKTLKELNALTCDKILLILTNLKYRTSWYNHTHLISTLEKCKMREEFYDIRQGLFSVKDEIATLENSDEMNLDEKIQKNREEYQKQYDELLSLGTQKIELKNQMDMLELAYNDAQKVEKYQEEKKEKEFSLENLMKDISLREKNLEDISSYQERINRLKFQVTNLGSEYTLLNSKTDTLRMTIKDIKYTQKEFDESAKDRQILREIVSATSSKDGIPLILIKLFLDNCKEIVNELISDVFDDSLEILDFELTDTEFKIPYICNGMVIEDIESASQGQRAIISIALSFALIRQSMFDYNIMLLDEIDGPLYKKDRDKFISILFKQLKAINAQQVFLITHNNTFEGSPVNIIMTTEEVIDKSKKQKIYRLY